MVRGRSMNVVLYVEGGGDDAQLLSECRKGFNRFLEKAGLKGKMPRVKACGSRANAFDRFKTACAKGDVYPILLVDSECAVPPEYADGGYDNWKPWDHVKQREGDGLEKPSNASDKQLHFMTQCMESWFLADLDALAKFYGNGFDAKQLGSIPDSVETIAKKDVFTRLENASEKTKTKGVYSKGGHSFKLLEKIDPNKVAAKSKWAKRFIEYTKSIP